MANEDQLGFLAHELQEHYPFMVNGIKDGPSLQSVNYIGLVGLLVQEIKELKKLLKNLFKIFFNIDCFKVHYLIVQMKIIKVRAIRTLQKHYLLAFI
jgi:hypothetical protein